MTYNFDELIDRCGTDSAKWKFYGEDVLPMWVADMDFRSPQPIIEALHGRISHGVFGYCMPDDELIAVICDRMQRLYNWQVQPDEIIFLPGVVTAFNVVCRGLVDPDCGVLIQPPVYPPFHAAPANHAQILQMADLTLITEGRHVRYEIDFDAFEAAITPETQLFLLCHPHNPTGQTFSTETLTRLAEICARHNITICSDEIHCDLLLDGCQHTPTAAISPDIAANTVTLMAPSKTFNVPGLGCSFAIVQNEAFKKRLEAARAGIVPYNNILGYTAALAAYRYGDEWLSEALAYITANRNVMMAYLEEHLPTIRHTVPEATYLMWLDCRDAGIDGNPHKFFLEKAKVALNDGANFGQPGEGFVRFNFATPRARMMQALEQMRDALQTV